MLKSFASLVIYFVCFSMNLNYLLETENYSLCSCHGGHQMWERSLHRSAPLACLSTTDRQPGHSTGQPGPSLAQVHSPTPGPSSYHLDTMFGLAPCHR